MAENVLDPSSVLEVALDETTTSSVSSAASPSPAKSKSTSMSEGPHLPLDSPLRVPFTKGWRREVVQRQTGGGADAYYFGPSGKKYRSVPEILKALGPDGKEADPSLSKENFSFSKNVLGYDVPGTDVFRSAHPAKGRASSASTVESPPPKKIKITKALDPPKKKQTARKTMPNPQRAEQIVCVPELCEASSTSDVVGSDSQTRVLSSLKLFRVDSRTDDGKDPEQEGSDTSGESGTQGKCRCRRCASLGPGHTVVCCGNVEFLRSAKTDKFACITKHPVFKKLVLDKDALTLTRHLLCLKTKNLTKKSLLNAEEPLNISWRFVAYKQFVAWVNTCIAVGGKVQVAIPSCVVQAVREAFPETDGKYSAIQFTSEN